LRILILADHLDRHSLTESELWIADVAERWVESGHRVQALCVSPLESWQEPAEIAGVTVQRPSAEAFEPELGEMLRLAPDIVHVASRGPLSARVCEILRELPTLLDVHDFWPICPNDDLLERPSFEPCAIHHPDPRCGSCSGLLRLRAMEPRRLLVEAAGAIVTHGAGQRERLEKGLGRPVESIDLGVDPLRFRSRATPPLDPEAVGLVTSPPRPRALFLGPPAHALGSGNVLDLLVATRARLPDVEFVVMGRDAANPDWHHLLTAQAREMGLLDHLRLLTRVPASDLPAVFAACDVGIAPRVQNQPGGLSVLQAMASGLPVVGTPGGALGELVRHGQEGLLISPEDVSAFSDALSTLLSDEMARIVLGESARLRVIEKHDRARTMLALADLYDRLRGNTRTRAAA
jgi:glycosyltransferase involved in cell wall biosynthesis